MGLEGTVANWRVGDVIDFLGTNVTGVQHTGTMLTVTYDDNKTATYGLKNQEANTQFQLNPDGNGGTILTLVSEGGVQQAASQVVTDGTNCPEPHVAQRILGCQFQSFGWPRRHGCY